MGRGCKVVPLIARPLARNTVERFARNHGIWRVTTPVMDENKQAMIEADEFDAETMMVMFRELRAKQIRAEAEGEDALSPEMRQFIEEAKASGITRCPIRDIEEQMRKCPVDLQDRLARGRQEGGRAVLAAGDGRGRSRHGRRHEGLVTGASAGQRARSRPSGAAAGEFLPHVVAWNLTQALQPRVQPTATSPRARSRRAESS